VINTQLAVVKRYCK